MKTQTDARQVVPTGRDALLRVRIIVALLWLSATLGHAQVQQAWVYHYNNSVTNGTNQIVKMALDNSGNAYVTGPSQNANTNLGYATLKIAPNGTQIWAERFDSTNYPSATPAALALDSSNDVIVTGSAVTLEYNAMGSLLWNDPYNAAAVGADGSNNVYITGISSNFETMKLSPLGPNLWTAVETGLYSGPTSGLAVAVDSAGEAFAAGDEPYAPQSFGDYECLTVVKYTTTGGVAWRNRTYTNGFTALGFSFFGVSGLTPDSQTNLYMELGYSGGFGSYVTFKFSNAGNILWLATDPTTNLSSQTYGLALDMLGNSIVTGKDGHGYPNSTYGTYKISPAGSYTHTNLYPPSSVNMSAASAVAVDSANNYYVTGYSPGTNGFNDIVTIKYNQSGGQAWLERYSSPVPGNAAGNAIAVDNSGNVYVAGYDTGPGGGTEMVVIKYSPVTLQVLSNGTVQLQAQGSSGELFDVQATSDLQNWQDLGKSAADTNGLFQFDDTNAPQYPARFYTTIPQ